MGWYYWILRSRCKFVHSSNSKSGAERCWWWPGGAQRCFRKVLQPICWWMKWAAPCIAIAHLPFLLLSPGLLPFNGKTKNSMRQDDPSPWKRAHPEGWLDGYEDELAVNSDFSNFASDTISSCTSNWMTKELNETCLNFMTLPQKLAGWPGITLLWVVSKGRGRLYRCRMDLVMKQGQV